MFVLLFFCVQCGGVSNFRMMGKCFRKKVSGDFRGGFSSYAQAIIQVVRMQNRILRLGGFKYLGEGSKFDRSGSLF